MNDPVSSTPTSEVIPRAPDGPGTTGRALVPLRGGPRLPRTYVPRLDLWDQLDRAAQGAVTLVVAPAGAGKTLGIGGWLQNPLPGSPRSEADALWVAGDGTWGADRLEALLDLAVATTDVPTATPPTLPTPQAPPPPRLVVIDDAHQLPPSAVSLLDRRLNQAPQTMRVLLLSRWDLALTRLAPELLGHFTVLRGDALRMDETESAALVNAHVRTSDPELVDVITSHAQGWCAAVVLMARAVATSPNPAAAARQYAGVDARVAGRVASEVFAALKPAERHLLLCVAHEGEVSVSTARHLTRDPHAGEVLNDLETTGLLVTRVETGGADPRDESGTAGAGDPHADPTYRIHPLLAEVIRRRLAAGGVDVAQARSTVARAVGLDIERGETARAFERLVAVNEPHLAAGVLEREGVAMVTRGQGAAVAAFVRAHTDVVRAHPGTWFPVAIERWVNNDVEAARHWMDRVLAAERPDARPSAAESVDQGVGPEAVDWQGDACGRIACIRLMRARLGLEPLAPAVGHAQRVVLESHRDGVNDDVMPQLLVELGITQNWTGDLAHAQVNLTTAVGLCRSRNLPALAISAASHLAMTEYMAGRERSAREVATETFSMLGAALPWRPQYASARAALMLLFSSLIDLPWSDDAIEPPAHSPVHAADLCTRFWVAIRAARLALRGGSAVEAERILETPVDLPLAHEQLPDHLKVVTLIERAFIVALLGDRKGLRAREADLLAVRALGEAALVAGLDADLAGDVRGAAAMFGAAASDMAYAQPASRELALVCEAQLLDALGEHDRALRLVLEAATTTAVRRNAVPFLGWTRHGTPIAELLRRLAEQSPSPWVHELAEAAAAQPDVTAIYATTTPTVRERDTVTETRVRPVLSPRERDVLHELSRGSTYADIAANLFVSENTVKTHVSSLYAKLAANRRSEALAVARSLHLL